MRKLVVSAAILAISSSVLIGIGPQAHAAQSCIAGGCNGLLAANTTCVNDAEIIYSNNIYNGSTVVGNIQLRYSPSCRAAWGRVISNLAYGSLAYVGNNAGESSQDCAGAWKAGTGCNTTMIDDDAAITPNLVACAAGDVFVNASEKAVSGSTGCF
ncbi:MAG TPA: DUF2690 domain-containing protein [Trebonia sp.]|jgi:hypothetical protein